MTGRVAKVKMKAPSSVLFWHTFWLWVVGGSLGYFVASVSLPWWGGVLLFIAAVGFLLSVDRWIDKSMLNWAEEILAKALEKLHLTDA